MTPLLVHDRARQDLIDHYVYLTENAGAATADRFLQNAEESFDALSRHPHIGTRLALRSPELQGMRKWAVNGFDNFLIFYLLGAPRYAIACRGTTPLSDDFAPPRPVSPHRSSDQKEAGGAALR